MAEDATLTAVAQTDQQLEDDREDEKENAVVIDFKMVTFSLAGKDYAIDIMNLKEIVKASRFTYVPNTVPFVLGVYNLRGDIIPIIDLRKFFNIEVPPRKADSVENMLIVTVEDQTFGVVVDAIDKVVGVQKSAIQPPHPLFGDINIKYIYGVVESSHKLYILLDTGKIFSSNLIGDDGKLLPPEQFGHPLGALHPEEDANIPIPTPSATSNVSSTSQDVKKAVAPKEDTNKDFSFVVDELKSFKKFYVTNCNSTWVQSRFNDWVDERKDKGAQLQNIADADAFLSGFWSRCTGQFWDRKFADEVYKLLPDNTAKQIVVWNPGCGKGYEAFSLACVLRRRYPSSKIRVYAHETDLLGVSNAPLLTIPSQFAEDWFAPFVTKKVSGEYTFTQDIKDIIMFEYHDIVNSNALPMVDMIFVRDTISMLPPEAQSNVIAEFEEKLKGNGIVILGENETIGGGTGWGEKTVGSLTYYNKQ